MEPHSLRTRTPRQTFVDRVKQTNFLPSSRHHRPIGVYSKSALPPPPPVVPRALSTVPSPNDMYNSGLEERHQTGAGLVRLASAQDLPPDAPLLCLQAALRMAGRREPGDTELKAADVERGERGGTPSPLGVLRGPPFMSQSSSASGGEANAAPHP
jgi:hypothetical protein